MLQLRSQLGVAPQHRRVPAATWQFSATTSPAARALHTALRSDPSRLPRVPAPGPAGQALHGAPSTPDARRLTSCRPRTSDSPGTTLNGNNSSATPTETVPNTDPSRREALGKMLVAAGGIVAAPGAAGGLAAGGPARALPLGPLGPVKRVGGDKRTGLTAAEVAGVLRRDLAEGQYFVTGDLTREVFADDCRFVDPTNDVTGLSKYLTALGVLFDPKYSKVELLDIRVTGPRVIEADWRLGGYLVFPWSPRVEPFTGHTVYTLDEQGLVSEQRQSWSISAATALLQSFTPSWGPRRQLF